MTRHAPTPRDSFEYMEAEARAERRGAREERRRETRVPMADRETARYAPEEKVLHLRSDFTASPNSYVRACVWAERYRHGIEIGGWGTVEQLRELRDALTAHIRDRLEAEDE